MSKKYHKIAFPHMGNYYIPVKYLLRHITSLEVMDVPRITSETIALGNRYAPEFVCSPFKYTLGTLVECLDKGADILLQAGGGCRYGYYSELQEQILKDLGYDFLFINFVSGGKSDIVQIYKNVKKFSTVSLFQGLKYLFITIKMVQYMDSIDMYVRENIGFEVEKDSFFNMYQKMYHAFSSVDSIRGLKKEYRFYKKAFEEIPIRKPENYLKIGLIGELYTLMEPYANYQLEYELAKKGMAVTRFTNVDYLLFRKKRALKKMLKKSLDVRYPMGADASDNICRTQYLCEKGYDGIIHIKSTFCTPEIGAMPIIREICSRYQVPVLFFSFDANTSEVGMKTRLEAFYDMLEMRREK